MRVGWTAATLPLLLALGVATHAQAQDEPKADLASPSAELEPTPAANNANRSTVVYVSDFDLDAAAVSARGNAAASTSGSGAPNESRKVDGPAEQARMLVDYMSATLVKELEKAGFTARRMKPGEARPEEGIQIKGVFTEPDADNHLRRAVVGAGPSVGRMALFVGIGNLARPEQALYAVVDPKAGEEGAKKPGAMINVSAYAPVARFEMPKNVTEKAVKDTAAAIVADLTLLLGSNVAAATR